VVSRCIHFSLLCVALDNHSSHEFRTNHSQAGPIPTSLGELDELRYLSLDGNNFSGSIPDVFHELTNLGMSPRLTYLFLISFRITNFFNVAKNALTSISTTSTEQWRRLCALFGRRVRSRICGRIVEDTP
jgi:hypothetical protein